MTDLDVTTHLHPEGRGIALVELTASLLHFFSGSPTFGWIFWPLWFTWSTSTVMLLCLTTSHLCEQMPPSHTGSPSPCYLNMRSPKGTDGGTQLKCHAVPSFG